MASGLVLTLALLATPPAAGADQGEPLPAGAPTDPYQLTAWCYGAMGEWIDIYERVKPDLRAIDKTFGSSVKDEAEPYQADMKAAREELTVLAGAVEDAEKASAEPIAQQGAAAIKLGRSVWRPAEEQSERRLADAWLTWALPDKCDTVAKDLSTRSRLLGQALKYNAGSADNGGGAAAPVPPPEASPAPAPPAAATDADKPASIDSLLPPTDAPTVTAPDATPPPDQPPPG
jgi:hypothetical protein